MNPISSYNENQCTNESQEDEIDLRELFNTIKKGKYKIVLVSFIVTFLTLIYVLKLPNVYQSEAILIPATQSQGVGSLGGLAALAGVSGTGAMTPDVAFTTLLADYEFMKKFVVDNGMVERYNSKDLDKNYVFTLNFRGVYDFFTSSKDEEKKSNQDELIFETIKTVKANMSITADKKTTLISVTFSDSDRSYPPVVINSFLKDASKYLVENNLKMIDDKLKYFTQEMSNTEGFELRQNLSSLISKNLEEKVMIKSKQYYQCDVLTQPCEPYIKDKTKPKRGLILVVAFVTSIIIAIFGIFFLEFIRNSNKEQVIHK